MLSPQKQFHASANSDECEKLFQSLNASVGHKILIYRSSVMISVIYPLVKVSLIFLSYSDFYSLYLQAELQLNFQKRRGHGVLSVLRPKFSGVLGEALDVAARWSGDVVSN